MSQVPSHPVNPSMRVSGLGIASPLLLVMVVVPACWGCSKQELGGGAAYVTPNRSVRPFHQGLGLSLLSLCFLERFSTHLFTELIHIMD